LFNSAARNPEKGFFIGYIFPVSVLMQASCYEQSWKVTLTSDESSQASKRGSGKINLVQE